MCKSGSRCPVCGTAGCYVHGSHTADKLATPSSRDYSVIRSRTERSGTNLLISINGIQMNCLNLFQTQRRVREYCHLMNHDQSVRHPIKAPNSLTAAARSKFQHKGRAHRVLGAYSVHPLYICWLGMYLGSLLDAHVHWTVDTQHMTLNIIMHNRSIKT